VKILSMSDRQFVFLKSPGVRERFKDVDLVISGGDLPYYYLESVSEFLRKPLFFVRGNHDPEKEYHAGGIRTFPGGCTDLHRRIVRWDEAIMAGIEGSVRYNNRGQHQYTQSEMWGHVFSLVPGLFINKLRHGRFLDVFVTHAPPWGIHDKSNLTHQGIKAFRWLIKIFQPKYHLHGHIHVYHTDTQIETQFGRTLVINIYGYRVIDLILN
jgi:Icc-related predicted phosphoesterase